MTKTTQPRPYWHTANVRARDLYDNDIALIDGKWRALLDAWSDKDDPTEQFGADSDYTRQITAITSRLEGGWMAIRYLYEEGSSDYELDTPVVALREVDLIAVQTEESSSHE